MKIEEVIEEIPNFELFADMVCNSCTANDWYCPTYCETLEKARRMDFRKIQNVYAKHDGELWKVCRFIKQAKKIE